MSNPSNSTRVIAIVGPYSSGKTSLLESLLYTSGAIPKKGTVKDKNTVGDSAAETKENGMSIEVSVASTNYNGGKFTFLDCPGSVEFAQEAQNTLMIADAAIVVCEPEVDKASLCVPTMKLLHERKIPHVIFINKMDLADSRSNTVFEELQKEADVPIAQRQIPLREGEKVVGYIDLITEKAYKFEQDKASSEIPVPDALKDALKSARTKTLESLADFNDELLEKILEDKPIDLEEINNNFTNGLKNNHLIPLFWGSALGDHSVRSLLKTIDVCVPDFTTTASNRGINIESTDTVVQVFKTFHLPHRGKVSLSRVWSGVVKEGMTIGGIHAGGLVTMKGHNTEKAVDVPPSEIVGFSRMEEVATGASLSSHRDGINIPWPKPLSPLFSVAVRPTKHGDEIKLSAAMSKVIDEDPSLVLEHRQDTKELLLWGRGEIHLKIACSKLKTRYNLEIETIRPQVPYKETIRRSTSLQGKHKKQTGGHGQFGDVHIEIGPQPRGEGFKFSQSIKGGSIPGNYFPAVEAGVIDYLQQGPLGFPVVDVAVNLFDGSYHRVDSSEMAFKMAGIIAMKEGMPKCDPILLEPIFEVNISIPTTFVSRMQKLVTGLRGQIIGMSSSETWKNWDKVLAHIPQAEMHNLIIELRSMTHGLGFFDQSFHHLQELVGNLADKVIAQRKIDLEKK